METAPEYYRILSPTRKLKPSVFKSVQYLDLDHCIYFLSCQKTGIQLFGEIMKITPSNFSRISYLDLEGCYYEQKINLKQWNCQEFHRQISIVHGDIVFRGILNNYIYSAKKRGYDIGKYFLCNKSLNEFPICSVLLSFLQGLDYRMHVLLQYGFQRIPISKTISFYRRGKLNPLYTLCLVFSTLELNGLHIGLPDSNWKTYAIHRTLLVFEMVYMLCRIINSTEPQTQRWKKCCTLLWRSIPDPYLSLKEIWKTMDQLALNFSQNITDAVCKIYKKTFPEISVLTVTPRSLSHSCRCVIRYCMLQNYSLPLGIDKLEVPSYLKGFLKLED